jgi:DNA-binding NarL/FixJ family response regulator
MARILTEVRVLLVDDSRVVRARLASLLDEILGVEIVGETGDAEEAVALVRSLLPDVVVLDLHMPGKTGLHALPRLVAGASPPEVIVLTNHSTPAYRRSCLARGATWFFDKSSEFHRVVEVLSAKLNGP